MSQMIGPPRFVPMISDALLEEAKKSKPIFAEDLRCGNVFCYQDKIYVCLTAQTDDRHKSTFVTAIEQQNCVYPLRHITAFQFFRTFRLPLVTTVPLELEVIQQETSDIPRADVLEMADRERWIASKLA